MSSSELKKLQTRLKEKQEERKWTLAEIEARRKQEQVMLGEIQSLEAQIKKLKDKTKEPIVSEHAMLRYIERVIGVNLDDIRTKILTPEVKTMIDTLGNGKFPIEGGRIVVKDRTVVTVEPGGKV